MKRKTKRLSIAVAAIIMALSVMIFPSQAAHAGGNGQQVSVGAESPDMKLYRVVIEGRNQDDYLVAWDSLWATQCHTWDDCARVYTNRWWWKGYVDIKIYMDNDDYADVYCTNFIPEDQWGNWVDITFYYRYVSGGWSGGCYID